jgi:hypothetical protein
MSITNYSELQSAIADYLARADLTARIPDFITLCESRLNRVLRTRDMESGANITLSGGGGALPVGYLEWITATWNGTRSASLRYVEPDSEEWRFRYRPNGDPTFFTVLSGTLYVRPLATGTVSLYYYFAIPALSGTPTNWLLNRAPDMYVNGALAEAYKFIKDDAKATQFYQLFEADIQKLINDADTNKVARRPYRAAELQNRQIAQDPSLGGTP